MDYPDIYKDVNQISMQWEKIDFSNDVSINRMYMRLQDLDMTSGPGTVEEYRRVKCLYIFADVVDLPPNSLKVRLPGSDKLVIICRLLRVPTSNERYVTVSSTGKDTSNETTDLDVEVIADLDTVEFNLKSGSVTSQILTSVKEASTITCSIESGSRGNFWILDMRSEERFPHSLEVLNDHNILLAMQSTMLVADLVQAANSSGNLLAAVTNHVEWLRTILAQVTDMQGAGANIEHLALLSRAQMFLKMGQRKRPTVPRLQYHKYKDIISVMVRKAQDYDRDFKQLKLFIEQNKILGCYLLEQNKVLAARERDMDSYHAEILSLTKSDLKCAVENMKELSAQMDAENEAMEKAKIDMNKGIVEYKDEQVAKAVFLLLSAVASIASAIATGGATAAGAVASAEQAANLASDLSQRLKDATKLLESVQKVMDLGISIKDLIQSINRIGQLVDASQMPKLPSDEEWDIFINEVELVAATMPREVTEVPMWKAKCKNVAILAKEIHATAARIAHLEYRKTTEELLQKIASKQAERLKSTEAANITNYMEMATQIDMRTTRMLLELIKLLGLQDAAIRYEYLRKPMILNAWPVSIEAISNMLMDQEAKAIRKLHQLGTPVDLEYKYMVKDIPVSLLKEGKYWTFEISMEDIPSTWSRVRIRYLEMKFVGGTHNPKTATNQVYILLQSSRFFKDRKGQKVRNYEASDRMAFPFAYDLETGQSTHPNKPASDFENAFMHITPFTEWSLRLSPYVYENQGLVFPTATHLSSTTQIAITFYVTAIRAIG